MPYTMNWIGNNVFVEMFDEIAFSEIEECNAIIYGDYRFDSMTYQLVDLTKITNINMSENAKTQDLENIVVLEKSATRWNNNVKVAFVTSDEFVKSLISEYAISLQETGWKCEHFETLEAAKNWCSLN